MKKQSNLSRLMGYAGAHKILTYLSWVLSIMSALLALVPFGIYGVSFTTYWKFPLTTQKQGMLQATVGLRYCLRLSLLLSI